jgi:translation initiation factor IF-3
VPVPRRFDRRPPERDQTRTNERIRVPEVRLVGEDGKQIGVIKTAEALAYAQERDLDLVEVAPDARPPVCRVLDYSKYKYEQAQKQKQARKHQQQITIREIKFRPKIAQNDYDTKKGHVRRFLLGRDRVKVTIMFRGREVTHPERGSVLLEKLAEELSEIAVIEQRPIQDGRNMTMMLAPSKAALAGETGGSGAGEATAEGGGAPANAAPTSAGSRDENAASPSAGTADTSAAASSAGAGAGTEAGDAENAAASSAGAGTEAEDDENAASSAGTGNAENAAASPAGANGESAAASPGGDKAPAPAPARADATA